MKPRLFIGSSVEQLPIAYAVQQNLEYDCDPTVWDQGIFQLNNTALDSLMECLASADFAIFIFAPDDLTRIKGNIKNVVRDNVIFEFGLFLGKLGKERTFFIAPRGSGAFGLPSDLLGIQPATYDAQRKEYQAALGPACNEIRRAISRAKGKNEDRLDLIRTQRDVYTYVFNRLNPFKDVSITYAFLKNLPSGKYYAKIDEVLYALDNLVHHYVPQFIEPTMRVYFAYKLDEQITVAPHYHPKRSDPFVAKYRIGIAYSETDDRWHEGIPVGVPSNVDRVYSRKSVSKVRDARRSIDTQQIQNEQIDNEGSVIALPVLYGEHDGRNECVGVIGISSPKKDEATKAEYESLSNELSTLFSAIFFAYGQYLQRNLRFEEVVIRLRKEIAEHFESKLTDLYPLNGQ